MSPEELLEAEVLIYLRGLGFLTDAAHGAESAADRSKADRAIRRSWFGSLGHPKINFRARVALGLTKIRDGLRM